MVHIGYQTSSKTICGHQSGLVSKRLLIRSIVSLAVMCLGPLGIEAATPDDKLFGYDPIFGLKYDSDEVRFETASAAMIAGCNALANQNWERRPSIYATTESSSSTWLVIGGFLVLKNPRIFIPPSAVKRGDTTFVADPMGVVLRRSDKDCQLIDKARDLFEYENPDVNAAVMAALSRDVVSRYSAAYGSADNFKAALIAQGVVKTDTAIASAVSPVMEEALRLLFSDQRIVVVPRVFNSGDP